MEKQRKPMENKGKVKKMKKKPMENQRKPMENKGKLKKMKENQQNTQGKASQNGRTKTTPTKKSENMRTLLELWTQNMPRLYQIKKREREIDRQIDRQLDIYI